jgi:hypothetical protein
MFIGIALAVNVPACETGTSGIPAGARLEEDGTVRQEEDGTIRVTEDAP